ncbi:afadin-like [Mugil cephalus]|uniref:afadin-like n=1 Tax=Mugil cephalus TaxID=48193 RepID=UPI001FB5723D|nr:afadin-like [Mugil cephalus]
MPEEEKREKLAKIIQQWNNNRLDLFEITQPDEKLEFHGVMRFYLEDHVGDNVATKCLRVCSNSATREVIETLSEKFRPDMKMLTTSYSLFEIHKSKERKLDLDERPLVVQLNWSSDNREGRFVLKKDKDSSQKNSQEKGGVIQNFKRTLSRKGKKEKNNTNAADKVSEEENRSNDNPLNNNSIYLSHFETRKRQQMPTAAVVSIKLKHKLLPQLYFLYVSASPSPSHNVLLPPAGVFYISAEDPFLSAVINYTNSSTVHFKLSPAYVLYAAGRFALRHHYGRGSQPSGDAHRVASITNKMVAMTGTVIERQKTIAGALAFWMSNSSELLNFLKNDRDLSPLTQQSQLNLSHLVHRAYSYLLQCLQNELKKHLPTFLIDPEQHGALPAGIEMVLNTLMNAMSLLRRCRVNPALTIQLFSQLFHFISTWLFNKLMSPEAGAPGLRSHYWGASFRQRLTAIEAWAERQGLELAADCHLGHIIQATTLLKMKKYSMQDAKDIQSTCFKLNSLQLQTLLAGYLYATNEPHIPPDLIDAVVTAASASADNLIRSEGRDVQLEESLDLHLPFLLPEGGYSCDTVKGIPAGFREFLEPICQKGLCSLTSQPNPKGDWTVFFSESIAAEERTYLAAHRQPEIETIILNKPLNSGMGISIVAAKGAGQGNLGIYIKSIVRGGPAEMNGRLTAGDQLISVDGQSLVGFGQERAAAIMMQTGPIVTLEVAKFGASYHGLGALLSEQDRTTGDRGDAKSSSEANRLYSHGCSKRKKDQIMQRNRQLYRSNPNVTTDFRLEEGDEPGDPAVRGNNIVSVSSANLCADSFHRQCLTLPNPKSQDKKAAEPGRPQQTFKASWRPLDAQSSSKRTYMVCPDVTFIIICCIYLHLSVNAVKISIIFPKRQALSQENLCVDSGGPLLDEKQNTWALTDQGARQTASHYSSFPIRSSVSSHDILSDEQRGGSRTSGAGVWRTPFSQLSASTPSIQPIRIDIPITRAVNSHSNPPLTTFRQSSSVLAARKCQTLKVGGHKPQSHIYVCPIAATKKKSLLQPQQQQQQRCSARRDQAVKPQVSITPTKHVSFQEPPPQQARSPERPREPRQLPDPWRREAQEKLEKQRRLRVVELLGREVRELQARAERTAEESERLRKLSLEWQFQRRLQEIQQRGEDEEEDEDLDMMVTLQQLEARAQNKSSSVGNDNKEQKEVEKATRTHLPEKEHEAKTAGRRSGLSHDGHNVASEQNQREKTRRLSAPEKLTFKERQRLFSLASSA